MNAKELRIGNLIKWQDESHEIVSVTAIDIENNECYVATSNNEQAQIEEFEPIQLTDELIYKLGFQDMGNCFNYNIDPALSFRVLSSKGDYYPSIIEEPEFAGLEPNIVTLKSIQYLHQLQNLFFALTGGEITFKNN